MADDKKKPGDVHIDLLEIDMTTGVNWLNPLERNRDRLDEIVARNRAKYLAEQKAERTDAKKKSLELEERAGKKTVVELWPEKDESREEFMGRCTTALSKCVGPKKAPRICATKWRKSEKLGKKEIGQAFVARGLGESEATEACGETCVGCKGADAPFQKFDSDEPRDDRGRWTTGGSGSGSSEPSPADEKLLLVSERPNQEKLDRWRDQLHARQEELNQQGETGNREDEHLNGMDLALSAYSQEDDKNLDSGTAGLNTVYDGDGKLLAASFTDVKGDVAKIAYFGAIDADAHLKVLDQVTKAFGDKVASIQIQRWKDDDPNVTALFEMAGFKETSKQGGLTNLSAVILEKVTRAPPANPPSLEHLPVPISISEGTGTDFQTAIAVAFTSIPSRALKTMADSGIKIKAGPKLTELKPSLKGVHPRGWPAGMTWDTAEGCYDRGAKEVLVTELYRPVGKKEFVPTTRARGVALHESGHAYDQALGSPSATSAAFASAYNDDKKYMLKEAKRGLKYFLQTGKAGRSETFAETFAQNAGNVGAMRTDIRPFFPRVSKLVKEAMDRGLWLEPIA